MPFVNPKATTERRPKMPLRTLPAMPRPHIIACVLLSVGVRAFVLSPASLSRRNVADWVGGPLQPQHSSLSMTTIPSFPQNAAPLEGAHGTRSRFLPIDQLDEQTYSPRIVQVAGALSDVTVADIMAVGFTPPPEIGMWQYDFSDPEGPQMGTVALPGSELVHNMVEPVVLVAPNKELNIQMPADEDVEVLVVVDRANREFELGKFFLWDTPDAGLQVRFFENDPPTPGFQCVGRVGLVMVPYVPSMAKKFTGFEEEDY